MSDFQEDFLKNTRLFFAPFIGVAGSPNKFIKYLKSIGWHVDAAASATELNSLATAAQNIVTSIRLADSIFENTPSTWEEWLQAANKLDEISTAVRTLPQAIGALPSPAELGEDIFQSLLNNFLNRHYPTLYTLLHLAGIVEMPTIVSVVQAGILVREKGLVPYINLSKLKNLLTNPKQQLQAIYWPNGLATKADADQAADRLFPLLEMLANDLGIAAQYDPEGQYDPTNATVNAIAARLLTVEYYFSTATNITASVGATIGLISQAELAGEKLPSDPAVASNDAGVSIVPFGSLSFTQVIGSWLATLSGDATIPGFKISQQGLRFLDPGQALAQGGLELDLLYIAEAGETAMLRIGPANGTHFEIKSASAKAYLHFDGTASDYGIDLAVTDSKIRIVPGDGDGFLQKILQGPKEIPISLTMGWNKNTGFYIGATGGFEHRIGFAPSGSDSFLNVSEAIIGLQFSQNGNISLFAAGSGNVVLGPVALAVSRTGIELAVGFTNGTGNFGPIDLAFGFKLPSGIGISINSEAVQGGGYLLIDQDNGRYAGVAALTIKEKLKLNALGLLQTKLPNGRSGYSFLLLITAEFTPIQLGLGFTLNGVGGIVGVNRTASTSALRSLVQNGRIDTLLFPASVLSNPQAAVATVDSAFPAAEGRYVFGIMAKIGWGTPNLLTLEAALIIELPAPVRLILLGVLRATLPNQSAAIIRLRADFIGIVDFGAKKISFDAVLVDSKILQFALTGNFSFRLYQGDNPVFLMTAGGFHPAFHPPANADLPTLRRLTLSLAQGGDFRLTLTSYLAITSSSVQFGSRLDLYVRLPSSFYIEGFLGFDALFRFNPFYLEVRIGAGVAIKRNGRSMLSISLNLLVSGPAPWHVDGEGSFKILFFRIRFRVNRTFGGGASQPALPTTDVRQLLATALQDKGNWEVIQPTVKPANTVVLRAEDNPSELMVDPGGALAVRQKVVPLDFPVEVYGNTRATNGSRFDVASVTLGDASNADVLTGSAVGELRDAFAPGQFRRMSDGEKLSAPAFQSLRSGLRLNTVDGLKSRGGQTRRFEFETSIIAPTPAGQQRAAPGTSALVAGGGTSIGSNVSTTLAGANLQRLAQMGAVSKTRRSYEQRRPSRKAPDQVLWDEDSYVIVSVRNLTPNDSAPNPFPTEAEATAYLRDRLAADPALAGELQVISVYQLDVSTSANAANLATA